MQTPHFWTTHEQGKEIGGIFHNGFYSVPGIHLMQTNVFWFSNLGLRFRSNAPLVFYNKPKSDASTPPASMRVISQKEALSKLQSVCMREMGKDWNFVDTPILELIA